MSSNPNDYVLPSSDSEAERLEVQGKLYGGISFLNPFLAAMPRAVLEVGAGTGLFTRYVAGQLQEARVVGVDMDTRRLAYARGKSNLPNLEFKEADMFHLPFDDDTFDLVFSRFVLVHATDPALALKEMSRVTRSGGTVVAYDMIHDGVWFSPEKPAFSEVLKRTIEVMKNKGMELSQGLHLPGAMQRAGFEDVDIRVIPHHHLGTDPMFEQYRANWIDTMKGLGETIGEQLDPELINKATAELEDKSPHDFLVEMTVLVAGIRP